MATSNQFSGPYEAKPDSGSLMASKVKKHEKAPDYFGEIKVNLKDMTNIVQNNDGTLTIKINGWKRLSKSGSTFLSLAVNRFVPQQRDSAPQRPQQQQYNDDDIPF